MGSISARGSKLYAKIKGVDGRWRREATGKADTPENRRAVAAWIAKTERRIEAERATGVTVPDDLTVEAYAIPKWIDKRRQLDLDYKNDESRLRHHVLPVIGHMRIADVRAKHLADLVHRWRTTPLESSGEVMSPRTVYNVHSVVSAMFRDAAVDGVIEQNPARDITKAQLGPLVDADPEWRDAAVYTRDEAETLISDGRIPNDRRLYYAFGLLAGLRPGEIAALRVRHYDAAREPLGCLTVAQALNTRKNRIGGTKTHAVRKVPVHATLAAMLGEWLLSGWATMMGRSPTAEDLLLPLPPADAAGRRSREGEPIRTGDYAGKKWREVDLPMLAWRSRELYAGKSTFITLAIDDGADEDIIRTRVTHAKARRNAFDGYDRGEHWARTCAEIAKLRLVRVRNAEDNVIALPIAAAAGGSSRELDGDSSRRGPVVVQSMQPTAMATKNRGGGGSRTRTAKHARAPQSTDTGALDVPDPLRSDTERSRLDQAVVQADPVAAALEDARDRWRADRDARALRRALVRLLAELEDP